MTDIIFFLLDILALLDRRNLFSHSSVFIFIVLLTRRMTQQHTIYINIGPDLLQLLTKRRAQTHLRSIETIGFLSSVYRTVFVI